MTTPNIDGLRQRLVVTTSVTSYHDDILINFKDLCRELRIEAISHQRAYNAAISDSLFDAVAILNNM